MKVKIDLFCYIQLYSLIHLLIFVQAFKKITRNESRSSYRCLNSQHKLGLTLSDWDHL